MFTRRVTYLLLICLVLCFAAAKPAYAQTPTITTSDLTVVNIITAVNALRASNGLTPYQVDPFLMGYAQEHARYQASINILTHVHSDGSMPAQRGAQEDIAFASLGSLNVDILINQMWSDDAQTQALIGFRSGTIGVGLASNTENDFISLDVRPETAPPVQPTQNSSPNATPEITRPGELVHTVQDGQTLWSIAVTYGITINDLRRMNAMQVGADQIIPGQKLIVKEAPTETLTAAVTATFTPGPATETPIPPTAAPTQIQTQAPIIPATAEPPSQSLPLLPILAVVLIFMGGIGMLYAGRQLRSQR
jgi:LysM repeat protein